MEAIKYKILLVPLEIDLKNTILYRLKHLETTINEDNFFNFALDILKAAKDPIEGVMLFYTELHELFEHGLDHFLEDFEMVDRAELFKQAGMELSRTIETIRRLIRVYGQDINDYNYAEISERSIALMALNDLMDADIIGTL